MKKIIAIVLAIAAVFSFAACGKKAEDKVIKVGASSTPHAEILEQVKEALKKDGYELEVVVYDDYVLPNQALAEGTLDANYFQHTPYLNSYNASNGTDLVSAALIHYEPFGLYGNGVDAVADIAPGATILIPADASAEKGVTTLDIVDAKGFDVQAVQADTVPAQLANSNPGTVAVINGNYALQAGLKVADALAIEDASGDAAQTYANIIACRKGDENSAKIQALVKALQTDAVKTYIADSYNGAVVAIF